MKSKVMLFEEFIYETHKLNESVSIDVLSTVIDNGIELNSWKPGDEFITKTAKKLPLPNLVDTLQNMVEMYKTEMDPKRKEQINELYSSTVKFALVYTALKSVETNKLLVWNENLTDKRPYLSGSFTYDKQQLRKPDTLCPVKEDKNGDKKPVGIQIISISKDKCKIFAPIGEVMDERNQRVESNRKNIEGTVWTLKLFDYFTKTDIGNKMLKGVPTKVKIGVPGWVIDLD